MRPRRSPAGTFFHTCGLRNRSPSDEAHAFSAGLALRHVQNFYIRQVRLQIFALHPAKICREIRTFALCGQAPGTGQETFFGEYRSF